MFHNFNTLWQPLLLSRRWIATGDARVPLIAVWVASGNETAGVNSAPQETEREELPLCA